MLEVRSGRCRLGVGSDGTLSSTEDGGVLLIEREAVYTGGRSVNNISGVGDCSGGSCWCAVVASRNQERWGCGGDVPGISCGGVGIGCAGVILDVGTSWISGLGGSGIGVSIRITDSPLERFREENHELGWSDGKRRWEWLGVT